MTYTASDVPNRIDVLINGEGYRFLETDEVKGISSFAPTFLQRTNVSDAYGDEDQDWWLTMTQRDWSLGEGQRFFSLASEDSPRRYWKGLSVDVREGSVILDRTLASAANGSTVLSVAAIQGDCHLLDSTAIRNVETAGSSNHGTTFAAGIAMAVDEEGENVYLSNSTDVKEYDLDAGTWSTFSASEAESLACLNNTLYGYNSGNQTLLRYSTAGAATTIFTWQSPDGTTGSTGGLLCPFGGDLAILRQSDKHSGASSWFGPATLWIYDGVAPAKVWQGPPDFKPQDLCVLDGVLFISGKVSNGTIGYWDRIYAYANGQVTLIWQSDATSTASVAPPMTVFRGRLAFTDDSTSSIKQYDPQTGAITTLAEHGYDATGRRVLAAGDAQMILANTNSSTYYMVNSTIATTGYVITSLFDGSTTRTKRFKSVVVEWDAASNGDGGSIDIAYRLNDVDGSYTSVQTGAVSGTEYAIGQNGRAISIKVTLNKGTSTYGPRLKRIYVRAAPLLDTFRKERYVLDLTGVDGDQHIQMRDGITVHPKDGLAMATDLRTAIASTTPVTIVDEFGSYSAYLVPEECEIRRVRSQEYTAVITARQV